MENNNYFLLFLLKMYYRLREHNHLIDLNDVVEADKKHEDFIFDYVFYENNKNHYFFFYINGI